LAETSSNCINGLFKIIGVAVIMSGLVGIDGTYDGIIGDVRTLQTKMISYKHLYGAGDASVSLTGCGFAPTACIIVAANQGHAFGMGMASKQGHTVTPSQDYAACFAVRGSGFNTSTDFGRFNNTEGSGKRVFRCSMGSGQTWYLSLTSWDADGATFYCDTEGATTSNLEWAALFMR